MKKDGIDINFDISKHFTPILRAIFLVSMFILIFSVALSVEVYTQENKISFEIYQAKKVIAEFAFNVFLVMFGVILILIGVSLYKEGREELRELRKLYNERQT